MKVYLNKIEDVKEFVNLMCGFSTDSDLVSGRYVVDSKSLLGIFSLDLSKPIEIVFHGKPTDEEYNKLLKFVVDDKD